MDTTRKFGFSAPGTLEQYFGLIPDSVASGSRCHTEAVRRVNFGTNSFGE
jgi:hypothetical protein